MYVPGIPLPGNMKVISELKNIILMLYLQGYEEIKSVLNIKLLNEIFSSAKNW